MPRVDREAEDDTSGWTPSAREAWDKHPDAHVMFHGRRWGERHPDDCVRGVVRQARDWGLSFDDVKSMATFTDGFNAKLYRGAHIKILRKCWDEWDQSEVDPREASGERVNPWRYDDEADDDDEIQEAGQSPEWPAPLPIAAMPGLVGEFIAVVRQHTEADDAALLFQFLTSFGSAIGCTPYYRVEATHHRGRLFTLLVGETAKGRKGTSWDRVYELFERVAPDWARERIATGLSSGEGLIHAVRDPVSDGDKIIDQGVMDKRLLVISSEFGGALRVMARVGNTLSQVCRDAWDRGNLRTLTKNSPMTATGAHISQIGHTTLDELRRYLDATETANGFANRYLFCCVRRARLLPDGGGEVDYRSIYKQLANAIDKARKVGEVRKDNAATELWHAVYPKLSEARRGMLGAVTARAEAQVVRLALIYALLDGSDVIRLPHLEAALACWSYADQSAKFIFGDATGDPVADSILAALRQRPGGMTRADINELFSGHKSANKLAAALQVLHTHGLVTFITQHTGGRPVTVWHATHRHAE